MIYRFAIRAATVGLLMSSALSAACASDAPPVAPTLTSPTSDPGPPPNIPTTEGATLILTGTGVSPKQVRIFQGTRVIFSNNDVSIHDIQSNPLHLHTDCPELNAVGFLVPGQSRTSNPFTAIHACGFHDHTNEGDSRFYGAVFVDSR